MAKIQKLFISKTAALLLILLLFVGDAVVYTQDNRSTYFQAALELYQLGDFLACTRSLEVILNTEADAGVPYKAKVYLLLGICYEKLARPEYARRCYQKIKGMILGGLIEKVPEIPGLDPSALPGYREVLGEQDFFAYKKPVPVYDVLKERVIHAPKKSVEKIKKKRRKKQRPGLGRWLTSAAVVVGLVVTVALLTKKRGPSFDFPEIQWVQIPAGEFLMGDNFNEGDADERPMHRVHLDEYYISKYEVTLTQYNYYCLKTGREEIPGGRRYPQEEDSESWQALPVHQVSWDDADAFCKWLSSWSGENIHLPTEAQWEKAARGSGQLRYPWGNGQPSCHVAGYFECGGLGSLGGVLRWVGFFEGGKSPYSLYDMAGNVAEWCQDWYSPTYYSVSPDKNPQGPANGTLRVVRGGGIYHKAFDLRCANRLSYRPDAKSDGLGFRVVKEPR